MKIASTAADAAVLAPNTNRRLRIQATWYVSPQSPERNNRIATFANGGRRVLNETGRGVGGDFFFVSGKI
jgi:hypothetical protein